MKTLIAYKTKLGGSRQYAEWLADALETQAKTFEDVKKEELEDCSACAVISGTYGGFMPLVRFLKRNWKVLKDKKIAAIAVGGVPAEHKWSKFSYWLIPKKISRKIYYTKIPGKGDEKHPIEWGEVKRENLEQVIEFLKQG